MNVGVRDRCSPGSDADRPLIKPVLFCLANRISSLARASHMSLIDVLGARRMNFVPVTMSYVMMLRRPGSMS